MGSRLGTLVLTLQLCTATPLRQQTKNATSENERCFTELGCFSTKGPFFHEIYRPINFFPEEREHIDTRFLVYSRANPKRGDVLKWSSAPEEVAKVTFNASWPTKMLVHGWMDTIFFASWMTATANSRLVGAEIALLINKLEKAFGAKQETFHILGHSLGAHVAGYAGEKLSRLGRITGLDPADPYFQHMPKEVRLDPTDALLVDVVHTDGGSVFDIYKAEGLGMHQAVGHVDFYPNGGLKMPGCSTGSRILAVLTKGIVDGERELRGYALSRVDLDAYESASTFRTRRSTAAVRMLGVFTEFTPF